ncbi:sodium-independent anion transporter [Rhodobacterales bacterium 56_14_T64]|nr:sodium-independent anion transporter [Rhodobacterales bacterium 56_14_T64]
MMTRYFPILTWSRTYTRDTFFNDAVAAVIVTIMLIPQSLAYALLAGLPPEVGLYASIAPLLLYTLFGTSMTLAVGPVAVASLMTAAAIGNLVAQGTPEYLGAAILLALLSGLMLLTMGLARLGFLANFLSHPVISGFITASGLIIALSQLKHILGVRAGGHNLVELGREIGAQVTSINGPTFVIGASTVVFLYWVRGNLKPLLMRFGLSEKLASSLAKTGPVLAVVVTTSVVWVFSLEAQGVAIVGHVPSGLPTPTLPGFDASLWKQLALPALLISIVGYVETVSVAQTLAAKRRQRIDPDQELIALGAANIGSSISGGFAVTGGFSRSVVNHDAGAQTPAAGAYTAIAIALATLFLTPLLHYLPKATLAATIMVAVLSLIDLGAIKQIWAYSKSDFSAMLATILVTLGFGVELGIATGVCLSLVLYLHRTSRPHYAIVGQIPGTEHFRNILRHDVVLTPGVLSIRIDESLYFPNARFLEDTINDEVAKDPLLKHVVLMCSAVNYIDASALESLEMINQRLQDNGLTLHLSEVKGPVMDRLQNTHFLSELSGEIFLHQYEAACRLKLAKSPTN